MDHVLLIIFLTELYLVFTRCYVSCWEYYDEQSRQVPALMSLLSDYGERHYSTNNYHYNLSFVPRMYAHNRDWNLLKDEQRVL